MKKARISAGLSAYRQIQLTIKTYESFNHRRYGNPWIAEVIPGTTKPDFSRKVGGYTGAYGKGEAGNLYVSDPVEGQLYTFGQKDYRGGKTERGYARYENGEFHEVDPRDLCD